MSITPDLTIRETAALSGVSRTVIEKAVQSGILPTLPGPARLHSGATSEVAAYGPMILSALPLDDVER